MNKLLLVLATGAFITYAVLRRINDEVNAMNEDIAEAFRQVDQSGEAHYD